MVAAQEQHQGTAQIEGEQRHSDCGNDCPDDEGMPFPPPDFVDEAQGVMAEVLELTAVHWQAAGMKEMYAEFDEGEKQEQVKRGYEVSADLRGDLTETEGPGEQNDDEGGESYRRIDPDDDANSETPR